MHAIKSAFTLLELLVVISIITMLCAMVMPSLTRARSAALRTQCTSQLRQLSIAMTSYSDDWQGYLPPYITSAPPEDHPGLNWPAWSYPYYQEVRVLSCPASPGKVPAATPAGFREYDGSYGWSYDGTQGNRGPLCVYIRQPSNGYLLMDSGDSCIIYGANTWENLMEELDLDWDSGAEGCNRHDGQVNIAFVDAHVSRRNLTQFLSAPCKSGSPPWYIPWKDGELIPGEIPFPNR